MSKKETLLIQPNRGKFVQSSLNGKIVRVWLVDPDTNQQGTEIPYDDAIAMLALPHSVVCMAQVKDKNGKYCNKLDKEDMEAIEKKRKEYAQGMLVQQTTSNGDSEPLKMLIETQAKLIENQTKQLEEMTKKFEKLLKKADK